jgi:hypothetical protein
MELNARELSSLIWLGLFALWAITCRPVRESLAPIFRSLAKPLIAIPLLLMVGYVCIVVFFLYGLGVWENTDAKDTLLWLLGFALINIFETPAISREPSRLKTVIVELFGIAVVVEFVLNFSVMPLWVELLFVPFLALLGMLLVVAESRKEHKRLIRPLRAVQVIVGFGVLACAVFQVTSHFNEVWTFATVRQFTVPIALSLLFLPFIYAMSLYVAYDGVFRWLGWRVSDQRVRSYARRRTFVLCHVKLWTLAAWSRVVWRTRLTDKESVDAAVENFHASRARNAAMDDCAQPTKKVIAHCVYCSNPPNGQEHWLNRSLGTFAGNTLLTGRICTPCNVRFGGTIDLELARTAHTGVFRQVLGIKGRPDHEQKNVFEYRASQVEAPVQIFRVVNNGNLKPVLEQAVRREADGTLVSTRGRVLVIATAEGEQELRFSRGWGANQLRAAAAARGLLGGRPVSAHVPPPETVEEFVAAARDAIRAVFGPFEIDVYYSRVDAPVGPFEPTLVRFNLTPEFFRGVAKVAFHYFLWACPHFGGDEPEFSAIKAYIRDGADEPADFVHIVDSLVDRIPAEDGVGKDCHVFAVSCPEADIVVQANFFSQPVGPALPTFIVRLGRRPDTLSVDWRRAHVTAYTADIAGHDGVLTELPV